MNLDELDRKIVGILVADGRASYGAIGAEVNLSAPAVKRRVDRLRRSGVLTGFTARVDPSSVGWNTEAYVEVFFARRASGEEILRRVQALPEVAEAMTIAGDADVLLHVFAESIEHFERVLTRIGSEPFVARTRSLVVLSALMRRAQPPVPSVS